MAISAVTRGLAIFLLEARDVKLDPASARSMLPHLTVIVMRCMQKAIEIVRLSAASDPPRLIICPKPDSECAACNDKFTSKTSRD
jgi:hypothetical protein